MRVRPLTAADGPFMEPMMLIAGVPPERELPADPADMPHRRRLRDGWGRAGDVGVMARVLDEPLLFDELGAAVPEAARERKGQLVMRRLVMAVTL